MDTLDFIGNQKSTFKFHRHRRNLDLDSEDSAFILILSKTLTREHNSNCEGFRNDLQNDIHLNMANKTKQKGQQSERFLKTIQTGALSNTRIAKPIAKEMNNPIEVREIVKAKNKIRRSCYHSRNPSDKTIPKKTLNLNVR